MAHVGIHNTTQVLEKRRKRLTLYMRKRLCILAALITLLIMLYIPIYKKASYSTPRDWSVDRSPPPRVLPLARGSLPPPVAAEPSHSEGGTTRERPSVLPPPLPLGTTPKCSMCNIGVPGWSIDTNRDPNVYIKPNEVTTLHEPKEICKVPSDIFLLIVVCSAFNNFETRKTIRETWGNYEDYKKSQKIFTSIREKYKKYNIKIDSKIEDKNNNIKDKAMNNDVKVGDKNNGVNGEDKNNDVNGKDKNKDVNEKVKNNDVNEEDNNNDVKVEDKNNGVNGKDKNNDVNEKDKNNDVNGKDKNKDVKEEEYEEMLKSAYDVDFEEVSLPDFQLVFLLGLPGKNKTIQKQIDEEANKYGDIIQESFIDAYNNLTLKSIMMLKWVTNNCGNTVRYILKSDDDTYINVPYLILDLRNRGDEFNAKDDGNREEYLLVGDLFPSTRPIRETNDKWYCPRFMFNGRVYPQYLSGTGYAMSLPAARAIYEASLNTPLFHLEDVYITGMCSQRAQPRITPLEDPLFSFESLSALTAVCYAHTHVSVHRAKPSDMRMIHQRLMVASEVDRCEKLRVTQKFAEDKDD